MSLSIYLDDCAFARQLVTLLRNAGHRVVVPAEAAMTGREDEAHLQYAAREGLVLLTRALDDFEELHKANSEHAGILGVYQDNNPDRDMSYGDIVRAIANLENAGISLPGTFQVLNAWRY